MENEKLKLIIDNLRLTNENWQLILGCENWQLIMMSSPSPYATPQIFFSRRSQIKSVKLKTKIDNGKFEIEKWKLTIETWQLKNDNWYILKTENLKFFPFYGVHAHALIF